MLFKLTAFGFVAIKRIGIGKFKDKGDFHNRHTHMLIGTNTYMTYKEVKYGLCNVSVGYYQPIYDSEDVYKYVSKQIGKRVEYEIIFYEKI